MYDAVQMPPERQERIRSELSARFNEKNKEGNIVSIKSRSKKKLVVALVAAVIVLSLSLTVAVAYSSQIIELLGGGQLERGRTGNGEFVSVTITGEEPNPVEVVDGRVYFVLDGARADITGYVSETSFYMYEMIGDNGYRQVFVVGGLHDNLGWAEFIWDETGHMFASSQVVPSGYDMEKRPAWLEAAYETLGIFPRR